MSVHRSQSYESTIYGIGIFVRLLLASRSAFRRPGGAEATYRANGPRIGARGACFGLHWTRQLPIDWPSRTDVLRTRAATATYRVVSIGDPAYRRYLRFASRRRCCCHRRLARFDRGRPPTHSRRARARSAERVIDAGLYVHAYEYG